MESLFDMDPTTAGASPSALTLLDFTRLISGQINAAPHLSGRWVVAEISNLSQPNPHCFCELIQKDERGVSVARIKGVSWANNWRAICGKFMAATGRTPAPGMKLMLRLSANHSPAYGLSAVISDIDPAYTLGDAERRRREILAALQREGLLTRNKELPLAPAPQRVAIISSQHAAGYGDFVNQMRNSGYVFYSLLYPATLQGQSTPASVIAALDRVEMAPDFWDCVVIIRGGGSTDDLNSFDDLELARRVAQCPIPVVVGIGHERDRTVLDEIAHTRCKTPTAVAAFLIERLQIAEQRAMDLTRSVVDYARNAFMAERQRLGQFSATLPHLAPARLETEKNRLNVARQLLGRLTMQVTSDASRRLTMIASAMQTAVGSTLAGRRERLAAIPTRIEGAIASRIRLEEQRLNAREELIAAISPTATLRRGYSITRVDGKAVRSVAELPPGSLIETTFSDGTVKSRTE